MVREWEGRTIISQRVSNNAMVHQVCLIQIHEAKTKCKPADVSTVELMLFSFISMQIGVTGRKNKYSKLQDCQIEQDCQYSVGQKSMALWGDTRAQIQLGPWRVPGGTTLLH